MAQAGFRGRREEEWPSLLHPGLNAKVSFQATVAGQTGQNGLDITACGISSRGRQSESAGSSDRAAEQGDPFPLPQMGLLRGG